MFERFSDRARRVVVLAQEEARLMNHNYIGTEHILLALRREEDGVAARALTSFDLTLEGLRDQVTKLVDRGDRAPTGHIPFTHRAKKILELALREALRLGHNYIGTEHILLGLLHEGVGMGCQTLTELQIEHEAIRERVLELLHQTAADRALAEQLRADRLQLAADIDNLRAHNCRKLMTVKFKHQLVAQVLTRCAKLGLGDVSCKPLDWLVTTETCRYTITLGQAQRTLAWLNRLNSLLGRDAWPLRKLYRELYRAYRSALERHTKELQKAFDRAHA